jgi:hypothetical protein
MTTKSRTLPPPCVVPLRQDLRSNCPHCGAEGKYVIYYLALDGSTYGTMAGCFKLAKKVEPGLAKVLETALSKEREANRTGRRLASWFQNMLNAVDQFQQDGDLATLKEVVRKNETARRQWLYQKFPRYKLHPVVI